MKISFFEEFPSDKAFNKLKLLDYKPRLYIAAHSKNEFQKIAGKIKNKVDKAYYWPILDFSEGYYLSPFIKTRTLRRTLKTLKGMNILWDAELPRNRSFLLSGWHRFGINKVLINRFFKKNGSKIYTAEYNVVNRRGDLMLKWLGLSFSPKKYGNTTVKMAYNSMHHFSKESMIKAIKFYKKLYPKFALGLGTMGSGINHTEKDIKLNVLKRDLKIAFENGVEEVIVFRLGGLNKRYAKIINEFNKK